jgi:hypothetical protein
MFDLTFESPELAALYRDLSTAGATIKPLMVGVINKGALNVKNDARELFAELQKRSRYKGYLPHYGWTITYDAPVERAGDITSVIGPETTGKPFQQGAFGKGIEYGSVNAPPLPHLEPSLDAEAPRLEMAMRAIAQRAMGVIW